MSLIRIYSLKIKIPSTISVTYYPDKVRFKGDKAAIANLAEEIRQVSKLKNGQLSKLDKLTLKVSDEITLDSYKPFWVELPNHAWNIMASKFQDVVEGFEDNPFDFNDCGYTTKVPLDLGVEITDMPITE